MLLYLCVSLTLFCSQHVSLGSSVKLEVLKFSEDGFSFLWTKEGSRRQITTTTDKPNILSFQIVSEEDFGHYQCEVKQAGKVVLTVFRALYNKEISKFLEIQTLIILIDHIIILVYRIEGNLWGKIFVVEGLTTNILPTNEATLLTFTCSASSNHENITHEMS